MKSMKFLELKQRVFTHTIVAAVWIPRKKKTNYVVPFDNTLRRNFISKRISTGDADAGDNVDISWAVITLSGNHFEVFSSELNSAIIFIIQSL